MGSGPSYPSPTTEERSAQAAQASALQQYQQQIQQQQQQQSLLAPYIYNQLGLKPTYGEGYQTPGTGTSTDAQGNIIQTGKPAEWTPGQITGFEQFQTPEMLAQQQAQEQQQRQYEEQLKSYEAQNKAYEAQAGIYGAQQKALEDQSQFSAEELNQLKTGKLLQNSALEQQGYVLQKDEQGNITGLTLDPNSTAAQQDQLNKTLLQRSQDALAGKLPVDPSLERQFTDSEQLLRSHLQSQLGPGYETSTPGQKALADFAQRKQETIYSAQHGEIGSAAQLAYAGQGVNQANIAGGQGSGSLLQGAANYRNPYAVPGVNGVQGVQGVQSPFGFNTQNASALLGAGQGVNSGGTGLATLAQLYGQSLQPYQQQRQGEFQAALYGSQNNPANLLVRPFLSNFGGSAGSTLGKGGGAALLGLG